MLKTVSLLRKWHLVFESLLLYTFHHFPSLSIAFGTLKVIGVFADGPPSAFDLDWRIVRWQVTVRGVVSPPQRSVSKHGYVRILLYCSKWPKKNITSRSSPRAHRPPIQRTQTIVPRARSLALIARDPDFPWEGFPALPQAKIEMWLL